MFGCKKVKFVAISKHRLSSHPIEVETGKWARPNEIFLAERHCISCHLLDGVFRFVLECAR